MAARRILIRNILASCLRFKAQDFTSKSLGKLPRLEIRKKALKRQLATHRLMSRF